MEVVSKRPPIPASTKNISNFSSIKVLQAIKNKNQERNSYHGRP